ncbi:MFS transporter [Euzebyella marina]|uniref:MFS transporter n=1 Tax=Euzebyella marina TaxID=1761453 RepID=A0A3G2L404_9FLAO|nr:MFS transporter [Euzebyella marina]AYN66975.1 MFS transporter [Euzebyella marina]MBG50628.1 MFS transporter [Pseudozobellia sp.]|tara:strand:+ start:13051 stop:14199 length:1149 start_codon:yes stop_codon:yes gene_type:complete
MKSLITILTNARYFGPSWVFASINILFGTWAIYIPTVKENLQIDKSQLGFALFFLALGVFTVFPFASTIINKMGVGKATRNGVIFSCIAAMLPLLAPNYFTLAASLFIFGASNGFTDISMNTLVTEIEKEDKQKFMSASHGFFSLGGVLAGLGSFLIGPLSNPPLHMALAVVLVVVVNAFFYRKYQTVVAAPEEKESFSFGLFKPLLFLGLISFVSMGSEGAIVDWSGLYLKEISLAPEFLWGAGFLGFQLTMTIGRFLGDGISSKVGSVKMVAMASVLVILGYSFVLTTQVYISILGFAISGLGFSVIIPEVFRIGGNVKGVDSSQGVSFIAGTGYAGFLAAPPILGFLADSFSLFTCFVVLLCCAFVILGSTYALHKRGR